MIKQLLLVITGVLSFLLAIFHNEQWAAGLIGLLLFTNGFAVGYLRGKKSNSDADQIHTKIKDSGPVQLNQGKVSTMIFTAD